MASCPIREIQALNIITEEHSEEALKRRIGKEALERGEGIGGVMARLWFQRTLPDYFYKFMELCFCKD